MIESRNEEINPSEISLLPVFLALKEYRQSEVTEKKLVEIIENSEINEGHKNFVIANIDDFIEFCLNWGILHEIGYHYKINWDNLLMQISLEDVD